MDIVVRAAAAAVVGGILALLLERYTPELSLSVGILTGCAVLFLAASVGARVTDALRTIADEGGIQAIFLSPVMKCVAIGMISHLAAQICRDARQGSIASAVELCASVCALYVSLPLIDSLLSMVRRLL